MDDFFIGYDAPMPSPLARFTRRASVAIIAGATGVAAMLATGGHRSLEGGTFAFGSPETVTGLVIERPHPALVEDGQTGATTLLVARGKHGAADLVAGLDGRRVSLSGTRIRRHGHDMLELVPRTITPVGIAEQRGEEVASNEATPRAPATVQLRGEVVDTKCYLGVMVPGEGHTHRACASLCLRGGIPAALLVRAANGDNELYLLETPSGEALGRSVAAWAGRSVLTAGVTGGRNGWRTLRTTPDAWRAGS